MYLADDTVVGAPRPLDPPVQLAREKGAFFAEADGGRDLFVPVYTDSGEAILRVYVTDEELTGAVQTTRLKLLGLGLALLAVSVGLGSAARAHVPAADQRPGGHRRAPGWWGSHRPGGAQ